MPFQFLSVTIFNCMYQCKSYIQQSNIGLTKIGLTNMGNTFSGQLLLFLLVSILGFFLFSFLFKICTKFHLVVLAVGIPCLELMISLFGALCSASLALIFPPICEFVCCFHPGHRHRLTAWIVMKNFVLVSFGLFGAFVGTFVSLKEIVQSLSSPNGCNG